MDAPTIAEKVARNQPESLWHFLEQLPGSLEAEQLYALILFGTLGMVANYLFKAAKDEIQGNLLSYLFRDNIKRTMLSFFTFVGTALALVMSPVLMPEGMFIGWGAVAWMGITTGWSVDAGINKGGRREYSEAEREARAQEKK